MLPERATPAAAVCARSGGGAPPFCQVTGATAFPCRAGILEKCSSRVAQPKPGACRRERAPPEATRATGTGNNVGVVSFGWSPIP